ncbi:MAG: hypothetical protein N3B21_04365 [Clostridia bacterium]|nr:hypothetical protein [Clostridia bacterium]
MIDKKVVITGYSTVMPQSTEDTFLNVFPNRKLQRLARRSGILLMAAVNEAMKMAGLDVGCLPNERIAIFVGEYMNQKQDLSTILDVLSGCTSEGTTGKFDDGLYHSYSIKAWNASSALSNLPNIPGFLVALALQSKGYLSTELSTCAGGLLSVAEGYEKIRSGEMDVVITGGTSSKTNILEEVKYQKLGFFSADDYKIVEGAGVIILESEESSKSRGCKPLAEVISVGMSFSPKMYRQKIFDNEGVSLSVRKAVEGANLDKDIRIEYFPGTFSKKFSNDEENMVKGMPYKFCINSPAKECTGYTFAAAGIVELIKALEKLNTNREADPMFAIANVFSLGGQNASVMIGGQR